MKNYNSTLTSVMPSISNALKNNLVIMIFAVLCILSIYYSQLPLSFIVRETFTRVGRNSILVLSLIPPIICGLGLNFSIVIGAMAGGIGLLLITHWHVDGLSGLLVAALIGTFLSVLFGFLAGKVFNKTKGQEMITGLILGFFAGGTYQLVFIYMVGSIIPFVNEDMVLDTGVGLRNTINFNPATQRALDSAWSVPAVDAIRWISLISFLALICYFAYKVLKTKNSLKEILKNNIAKSVLVFVILFFSFLTFLSEGFRNIFFITQIPIATGLVIALACLLLVFVSHTKLGRDIKTVGQNMAVATSSGINVNKVRIIAVILSTILAAWGQIVFLQNIGNINTYSSHEQVGMFSIAALLVGGASVTKATIPQVFIGIVLFHVLYFTSPMAGRTLFDDPQVGEFFRLFISNIVIAISLALYTWRRMVAKQKTLEEN